MGDATAFQLPPDSVEAGVATGGGESGRYIRTDEGGGRAERHFIYEDGSAGLILRAVGKSRSEAVAKLGRSGIAWTPAGDPERARVAARRGDFLDAYIEALFGTAPRVLTVAEIKANALDYIAILPPANRKLLTLAMRVLEILLGSDFAGLDIGARQRRIVDRLDDFGGLLRDLGRLRTIFYASYFKDPRTFASIGFVPPQERANHPPFADVDELEMSTLGGDESCEWLVIGSGAGGAAAASALAAAGKTVIVLERGGYFPVRSLSHKDTEQYARIYVSGGLQTTVDRTVSVMQASAIGGSSLINNCICFRLAEDGWTHPEAEDVVDHWSSAFGLRIDRDRLDRAFDHLEAALEVHSIVDHDQVGANGRHLLEAWRKWLDGPFATPADARAPFRSFKMNFGKGERRCWGCGYCNSGCPYHRKNTVAQTLLARALANGARLVPDAEVARVVLDDPGPAGARRARSVEVVHRGRRRRVAVSEGVIVAAGVGASTEILRRSGIPEDQLGRKVTCNLACTIAARMPDRMNSWQGAQMATYVDRGTHLIESWFHPPATFAAAVGGWFEDHLTRMANYSRLVCLGLVMPTTRGRVSDDGQLSIELSANEVKQLRGYIEDVVRLHFAGGAEEVYLPDQTAVTVRPNDDIPAIVRRTFRQPRDFVMVTAHPQGGNPMSRNAQLGIVGANLRVHGCRNLFVADASIFPSSIRVNPQMTIMAFAHARFSEL
jgi:choline dehydrogenase-like flavoprotein